MKMSESLMSEMRMIAEDMVRVGKKILGELEGGKVGESKLESSSADKSSDSRLEKLFMKKTKK